MERGLTLHEDGRYENIRPFISGPPSGVFKECRWLITSLVVRACGVTWPSWCTLVWVWVRMTARVEAYYIMPVMRDLPFYLINARA
jgi:hypothetical protein